MEDDFAALGSFFQRGGIAKVAGYGFGVEAFEIF
jgi:hypothetical protein